MAQDDETLRYSIQELADLGGVSRRTIRYYVRRKLLPTPTGTGRGKHYTQEHLDTLIRIRELQESGETLDAIATTLAEAEESAAAAAAAAPSAPPGGAPGDAMSEAEVAALVQKAHQSAWTRVVIADGVELHLRGRLLSAEQLTVVARALKPLL